MILILLLLTPSANVSAPSDYARHDEERLEAVEVARIQGHLAAVEARLRTNSPPGLTPTERAARARNLDLLAGYREAGVFPHNHDFAGRVPYFVDAHGTRCAMAFLIDASGAGDLVSTVARVANNATVMELGRIPRIGELLARWLKSAGLTLEEAQAIQPSYSSRYYYRGEVTNDHALTAAFVGTACGATTALNLIGSGSRSARIVTPIVGIVSGFVGIAVGSAHWDDGGESQTLGTIESGIGCLSVMSGIYRSVRESHRETPARASGQGTSDIGPLLRVLTPPGRLLAVQVSF